MSDLKAPSSASLIPPSVDTETVRQVVEVASYERDNTARAFASDWSAWERWSSTHDLPLTPIDPGTFALFVQSELRRGLRLASVRRRVVGVASTLRRVAPGAPDPRTVPAFAMYWSRVGDWAVAHAPHAVREDPASPVTPSDVAAMVEAMNTGEPLEGDRADLARYLRALRDRAMLLLAFRLGMRRSELCDLEASSVKVSGAHVRVFVLRRKTGRHGWVAFNSPAIANALTAWREAARVTNGPMFRSISRWGQASTRRMSGQAVADVVNRSAQRAGLDATRITPHSFRAGAVTWLRSQGLSVADVQGITGHKDAGMVLRYDAAAGGRHADLDPFAEL